MEIRFAFAAVLFCMTFGYGQTDKQLQKELDKQHRKFEIVNDSLTKILVDYNAKIESTKDTLAIQKLKTEWETVDTKLDASRIEELKSDLNFAEQHPSSLLCLQLVAGRVANFAGKDLYDRFEYVYNNFAPEIRNSEDGKAFAEKLKYFKQSKPGSIAPDFSARDINGNVVSLSDFKGKKYVLIDFWSSHCGPCREEFPALKALYKKYGADFEIVSVSRDTDASQWKKAIAKEKIESWKLLLESENPSITKNYYVYGIPHKVLIDKKGVIIGKWKGGGGENKNALEQEFSELFGNK